MGPLTWSYFATIAAAQKQQTQERKLRTDWNFVMESEQTHNKMILHGYLVAPLLPVYNIHEILSAAYRVKIPQNCDMVNPMPQSIKDQLRKEKSQCLKQQQIFTKVSKSLNTQNGQCTNLKHSVVR